MDVSDALKLPPKMEASLVHVSRNTPSQRLVEKSIKTLNNENGILLTARGNEVKKLVAVIEQIKQQGPKKLRQLNRISIQPSLINPSYNAKHSIPNIQAFYGDEITTTSTEIALTKEIKGHKVYDVPAMSVLLLKLSVEVPYSKFSDWTFQ